MPRSSTASGILPTPVTSVRTSRPIRDAAPDFVNGPYLDTQFAPLLDQAVQVGFADVPFGTYGGSFDGAAAVADSLTGFTWTTITRAVDNADDEQVAEWRERYIDKYGNEPPSVCFYALSLYDPVLLLAAAISAAGTTEDLDAITDAMRTTTEWEGQVLNVEYDENGLAHYTYQQGFLQDGEISFKDYGQF